ncbi:hypothetical protein M3P05_05865 [Sansalvadorimonas sp. 2012CJ34-2]|uniref:Uncharacterized protein n=1 Tax=Parendozoicomonas callyspongiae TaxID=2942213 RepID=A0ABT0PDL8_9GAMM|nr:hypothetical protein [Sansalvadorimonas sp. 2012CJ34-2]MCL6269465.1 hypothetical protein [Sansalvadorimonas sp. 2012CJ34-2]
MQTRHSLLPDGCALPDAGSQVAALNKNDISANTLLNFPVISFSNLHMT